MTEQQWQILLDIVNGNYKGNIPVGFIIDCPWLPGWYGISTLDYFTSDEKWFDANLKAIETFPDIIFLPGFWAEYGMCTEPSAFGAKPIWHPDNMPHAQKIIHSTEDIDDLSKPDPKTDGLLPFVINRLKNCYPRIKNTRHDLKFAIIRGPLNIASFLMGATEFLMLLKTTPQKAHKLLDIITEFLIDWLNLQKKTFPSIEGIFVLDDILGFIGDQDFKEFALPCLKKIYSVFKAKINFLHNDADGQITAKHLNEIGVNLFNFAFKHGIDEIQKLTNGKVAMLGNIPPRDVLANGTSEDIENATKDVLKRKDKDTKLILSCGGGMPPGVSTENIKILLHCANANTAAS